MKNLFISSTPAPKHAYDAFDLSHEKKLSFKFGQIIPIYWDDIVPGDKFRVNSEVFIRFAPMLAPILHRINVFVHYFWVPYRLCMPKVSDTYADWEGFITGDPESEFTNEELPYMTISNAYKGMFGKGDLPDYFGLPVIDSGTTVTQDVDINVLPFFAYQLIYDNYYRDENLNTKVCGPNTNWDIALLGGDRSADASEFTLMRQRALEKDYFTGALPTAYNGSASDVELSIDIVDAIGTFQLEHNDTTAPTAGALSILANRIVQDSNSDNMHIPQDGGGILDAYTADLEMYELRRAQALTRALEAEKRGGFRYVEMLLGKWGVISDDYRTAIPQYIGGGKQHVVIQSILNTSQALDPTAGVNDGAGGVPVTIDPQANMAGQAISVGKTNRFTKRFTEHGIVMGLMSVIPRTAYQDGIDRYWRKADRFDFFDPYLQRIGDQAIDQSEVWYDPTGSDKDDVFGYAPRWSEYKFKNSTVHGDFRDDFDYWHMGRKFSAAPSLNSAFIKPETNDDMYNRIFAVETATVDKLYAQVYNNVRAIRPMLLHDIPI